LCYIFGEHSDKIVTLWQAKEWNRPVLSLYVVG
jgi:hypothetical protein